MVLKTQQESKASQKCLFLVSQALTEGVGRSGSFGTFVFTCFGTRNITISYAFVLVSISSGNQTGGSMNPARSFGPLIVSLNALGDGRFRNETTYFHDIWRNQWIYWLGPFLGALMASLASRFLLAQQKEKRPYMRIKVQ